MIKYSIVFFLIINLFVFYSCTAQKTWVLAEHIDVPTETKKLIENLQQSGIDTIISYQEINDGCMGSDDPSYIYWEHNGYSFITKLTRYALYNTLNNKFNSGIFYPILDSLKNEKLKESVIKPRGYYYNFTSYNMNIILSDYHYTYSVTANDKFANEYAVKVFAIDKFRSYLLDFDDWMWKPNGLQYKKEKFPKEKN